MEINIPLLIHYLQLQECSVTVNVSIEDSEGTLVFVQGQDPTGSRREYLDYLDMKEILIENDIIGRNNDDPSAVKRELEWMRTGQTQAGDINIEKLIYETLAKYIAQLFRASLGTLYYPEIVPLPKHQSYFKFGDSD